MNNIDRRQWLKSIGLAGTMAFINPAELLSRDKQVSFGSSKSELIKLNFNENPYGPSKRVRQAINSCFDSVCRYPFSDLKELVQNIAAKEGVTEDYIVVTGGSTEGLRAAGLTYGIENGEIIAADPTFQAMLNYAENLGAYVHRVPVNDKMEHDLEGMASRVTSKTRLIFLCNPNNPTGTILDKNQVIAFCNTLESKAVIFSDEAYYDYITEADYPSMVDLVKEGKNLIVSKTFSKVYGLAGIRIGYLIARPDIANRLKKNIMAMTNVLAIAAAKEALQDDDFYKFSIAKNMEAKQRIYNTLDELKLDYIPSHTNFVFFQSNKHINDFSSEMMNEGIVLGRPFAPFYDWARISTGKIEEVNSFCRALEKIYG